MPVIYNSKSIIPGPLFDITREVSRNESGKVNRQWYTIRAKGTVMAWKGSPRSDSTFWTGPYFPGPPDESIPDVNRLAAIRNKMKAMNELFAAQGQWLEIQPFDGSQSIKFQPRIRNIHFAQGLWYDKVEYTIDMEADTIWFGGQALGDLLTDVVPEETWSVEAADPINRTFRVTHVVSSQQKNLYAADGTIPDGNLGWQRAKSIVLTHLGTGNAARMYAPGVLNISSNFQPYNWIRSQQIDEGAGRFSVTETWVLYIPYELAFDTDVIDYTTNADIPPALDDFSVTTRESDGLIHVSIEGTVTGFEVRDWTNPSGTLISGKWDNAALYFNTVLDTHDNVLNRAQGFSGVTLNPIFLSRNIARNPIQGTITYNAEYSNRRLPLIHGAFKEDISIQHDGGTDVFASIPVLGRAWGPVLQGIGTITQRSMTVNISVQLPPATILVPNIAEPNTDGIVLSFAPVALQVFKERDTKSWVQESGRYNRAVTFVYQ
jgi:hypothetical protein